MRRRDVLAALGSLVLPTAAPAQPAQPVVGFLNSTSPDRALRRLDAFRQGLSETGFVEGRNLAIEYRWADSDMGRLPDLARDLVGRQVSVIAAGYNLAAGLAAKAATASIPIVLQTGVDPVRAGLVSSLNRPGGNLTAVTNLSNQLVPKHLEILRELVPSAKKIVLLINPANPAAQTISTDAQTAAHQTGQQLHIVSVAERDFETGFAGLRELQAGALVISPDSIFDGRYEELAAFALSQGLPSISPLRDHVIAGGLMSYGGSVVDQGREAGLYTGRILKGEKPADLPVSQVTKVELILNLKTAKALGLTVPLPLLGRADEVIE
jgi:putative tryptophan/tyrosine transport system substrate-binding protein